ncbi:MAG: hypothetical protein QM765_23345 [Myxococcales bacterium]
MPPLFAAVLADQTIPASLAAPLAVAGSLIVALLVLAWAAFRPGGPILLKRLLAAGAGLGFVWAAAAGAVALRSRAVQTEYAARLISLSGLGALTSASLDEVPSSDLGTCADGLEVGGVTSLAGYLLVAPDSGVPPDQLPRPGYPRLLVPTDAGSVSIASLPVPPQPAGPLPALFLRAATTAPWRWSGLLGQPANPLTLVRYLVVAEVRRFDGRAGRIEGAVRVVHATGGAPVCEGTYASSVPPGAEIPLASALEASAFSPVGRAGGPTFVDHVRRFAPLALPSAAGP